MNWKRGFRRIIQVLALFGAIVGFVFFGILGEESLGLRTIEKVLPFALLGVPIGYCLIWLIYYLIEWFVLGFAEDNPKSKEKEGEKQ
jgi:hypothetical protein